MGLRVAARSPKPPLPGSRQARQAPQASTAAAAAFGFPAPDRKTSNAVRQGCGEARDTRTATDFERDRSRRGLVRWRRLRVGRVEIPTTERRRSRSGREQVAYARSEVRHDVLLEPGISSKPGVVAPGGVRHGKRMRKIPAPVEGSLGEGSSGALSQMPALGPGAGKDEEFDLRHCGEDPLPPERSADGRGREIGAAGVLSGKAERHGRERDARPVMERFPADAHPAPQPIARRVVERNAALVHSNSRRLAANADSRRGRQPQNRARSVRRGGLREAGRACRARTNSGFKGFRRVRRHRRSRRLPHRPFRVPHSPRRSVPPLSPPPASPRRAPA